MSWFLVDDNFSEHPKVVRLLAKPNGFAAIGLWTVCGAWSRKHGTSGDVSTEAADMSARKCGQNLDASTLALALVEADLWVKTADGYRFNDWSAIYKQEDRVAKRKKKDAERKRAERRGHVADKPLDASTGQSVDSPQDESVDTGSSPSPLQLEKEREIAFTLSAVPVPIAAVPVGNTQQERRARTRPPPKPRQRTERDELFDLVVARFEVAHTAAHSAPQGIRGDGGLVAKVVTWLLDVPPELREHTLQRAIDGFFADPYWAQEQRHPFTMFSKAPGTHCRAPEPKRNTVQRISSI